MVLAFSPVFSSPPPRLNLFCMSRGDCCDVIVTNGRPKVTKGLGRRAHGMCETRHGQHRGFMYRFVANAVQLWQPRRRHARLMPGQNRLLVVLGIGLLARSFQRVCLAVVDCTVLGSAFKESRQANNLSPLCWLGVV